MELYQTIVLALIQGLSEFLPISSSAHLILVPKFTSWNDQGLAFDVTVHLGTLTAVVYYYRLMIKTLWLDFISSLSQRQNIGQSKLAWGILLGTLPVGLMGFMFKDLIQTDLRTTSVIAWTTLLFGLLLGFASWVSGKNNAPRDQVNWWDISFVGIMQVLALIPGVSRSGITITAGLLIGLSRQLSTQFAFLLSVPVIVLASLSILVDLIIQPEPVQLGFLLIGFVISALSAYFSIIFFIKLLGLIGLMPFVVYRLLLGLFLLILF